MMDKSLPRYTEALLRPLWEEIYSDFNLKAGIDFFKYMQQISEENIHYSFLRNWFDAFQCDVLNNMPVSAVSHFPFPHLWKPMVRRHKRYFFATDLYDGIKEDMASVLLRLEGLRAFKRLLLAFHRSAKSGTVVLRDRKHNMPDVKIQIRYYPQLDPYFDSAFSGRFTRDLEDGCVVIHTRREGTDQRIHQIYWDVHRREPQKAKEALYAYLDSHRTDEHTFAEAMEKLQEMSKYDTLGHFVGLAGSYIQGYVSDTLYNKGMSSTKRLLSFTKKDPIVAQYIWSFNFDTEKKRFALVGDMGVSIRDQNKLIRANTIEELQKMMEQKEEVVRKRKKNIYDGIPVHLWEKINRAEQRVIDASCASIGCWDDAPLKILKAKSELQRLWREADRFLAKNRK